MAKKNHLRIFSVAEANEVIVELRRTLPAMRTALKQMEVMEDRLAVLELICNRAVSADNPDLREFIATKIRYHRKVAEFEGMWQGVEDMGVLIQDLEKGMVHFASKRGQQSIFLCWREGEAAVTHWHDSQEQVSEEPDRKRIDWKAK